MKLQLPKAILLDMDDTIIANSVLKYECWNKVGEEFSGAIGNVDSTDMVSAILKQGDWFWSDPERHRIWRQDLARARRVIVEAAFDNLGLNDAKLAHAVADRYYELNEEAMHPFPGAIESLRHFRDREVPLGLVTNGASAVQRKKIERFGLSEFFDQILIEGEEGIGKPDERIYVKAVNLLGVEPGDAWMIGDNIVWDVLAPQKIGIKGIWIKNGELAGKGEEVGEPFLTISYLHDIVDLIS